MDDMKIIGENIRKLRKSRGMTQVFLAKAMGISVATLSSYETGKTAPPITLVYEMAKIFNTSVELILDQTKAKPTLDY